MTICKRDIDQKVLKIPKIPSLLKEKISCLDQTFQLLWNSPRWFSLVHKTIQNLIYGLFFLLSPEVRFPSHSIILRHILSKFVHACPGTIFCHRLALKIAQDFASVQKLELETLKSSLVILCVQMLMEAKPLKWYLVAFLFKNRNLYLLAHNQNFGAWNRQLS